MNFDASRSQPTSIAAQWFPVVSHSLTVGPHRLSYVDLGPADAETLLCVHGNPTWSFYYRRVIEQFSDRYRVVAIDHLGCGRSDMPTREQFPYTLAAHRDNLVQLVDQLQLQRVTLIAHDWGGAIGLTAMLRRLPTLVRIVLLNTAAFPPPYIPLRIAACRLPIVGTLAVRGLNAFARAATTMAMNRQRLAPEAANGLLAPYDTWSHRVAIDSFVRDIPLSLTHPTYPVLAQLERDLPKLRGLPIHLIWGMQDWCFRPECLQRFQGVWPHATTTEIQDAGHYVLEDAPEEVLQAIERFLSSNP
jgi:haloalkane dehalogenase